MKAPFGWTWGSVARGGLGIGLAAFALSIQFAMADQPGAITGRAEIISGDALHIDGRYIRLEGIDAPAFSQTCVDAAAAERPVGRVAATRLAALVENNEVSCRFSRGHEGEGVIVASCAVNGDEDLSGMLIDEGLVWPISSVGDYAERARQAQSAELGVWAMSCRTPPQWRADPGVFMGLRTTTN